MRPPLTPSIIDAIRDPKLFAPQFARGNWTAWKTCIRSIFGLPLAPDELPLYRECTGRQDAPTIRAKTSWLIVGRRGGKSRVLALIASYLAAFGNCSQYLVAGERARVVCVAADKKQAAILLNYIHAFLSGTELLAPLIQRETAEEIELSNNVTIEVVTCSYKTIRGRTVVAALCDEAAFWADETGQNPASAVIASLLPSMATIPGSLLLVASSPYAKRGPLWDAFKRYWSKSGKIFVWKAPTWVMHPSLSRDCAVIAEAFENDPASASSEYGADFRSDVGAFIDREIVDAAVIPGRHELMRESGTRYFAFADPSGGSSDSMTLAIAHARDKLVILDALREWRPPFSPDAVVQECAATLKGFGITRVFGDRYAGEWPRERFRVHGIDYQPAEQTKSELYLSLLPLLNSGRAELLDHARLTAQLCSLERRTARSGRDSIDHAPGSHDDLINSAAGALVGAVERTPLIIPKTLLRRVSQVRSPVRCVHY